MLTIIAVASGFVLGVLVAGVVLIVLPLIQFVPENE
jgi:tetrahydromethanopterin S-methyltransferase subunit F